MVYFPVLLFCTAGLFMALLQERYRMLATVGIMAGAYIIAAVAASLLGGDRKSVV